MYRLTRLATRRTLTKPLIKPPFVYKPFVCNKSPFDHFIANYSTDNHEDIEKIDPKDYPELYPDEQDQQVDTEWFVDSDYKVSEEDFIPLWQRRAVGEHLEDRLALRQVSQELMETGQLTAESLRDLLIESKLESVEVLDVREKCDWADYMIVASSSKGDKYLSSVAEHVYTVVKKALKQSPHVEGRSDNSGWLLIDLGRIVVHLFTPEMRERYDLEGLWKSVPKNEVEFK